MSAVKYECSICGARLFNEPNSPIRFPCPNVGKEMTNGELHPEFIMIQVENYIGPNLHWKEEGDTDKTKTGIITHGVGGEGATATIPVLIKSQPVTLSRDEELEELRAFWFRLTGTPADKRLKNETLRAEIEELERIKTPEPSEHGDYDEELIAQVKDELREELKQELLAELRQELLNEKENGNGNSE